MTTVSSNCFTWTKNVGVAEDSDGALNVTNALQNGFDVLSSRTQQVRHFKHVRTTRDAGGEDIIAWIFVSDIGDGAAIEIHILND